MAEGYIALHRQLCDWEWYQDVNTKALFLHCLLMANHRQKKWRGKVIERGSFITSLPNLADELGLSVQNVRTSINRLKLTHEITVKTTTQHTEIKVNKYEKYQDNNTQANRRLTDDQQTTNRRPTDDQQTTNRQLTTTNNDNNDNKKDIERGGLKNRRKFIKPTREQVREEMSKKNGPNVEIEANKFMRHYESNGWKVGKNPMKCWKSAVSNWLDRIPEYNNQSPSELTNDRLKQLGLPDKQIAWRQAIGIESGDKHPAVIALLNLPGFDVTGFRRSNHDRAERIFREAWQTIIREAEQGRKF